MRRTLRKFTSQTVRGQPSPRSHVETWLPFRNCEMDYLDNEQSLSKETTKSSSQLWKTFKTVGCLWNILRGSTDSIVHCFFDS